MPRRLAPLALALGFAACLCGTATAAPSMQVGVADDRQLLGDPEAAAQTVREWDARGVDAVRIIARWGVYAPDPAARTAPEGFTGSDPNDPRYAWGALDRAIDLVTDAGMDVTLSVTGWGPVWGTEFPVKDNPRYKPDAKDFAAYASAVAKRYGAKVDRYILWNEPNQPQWLQPQSECTRTGCAPFAPHQYRKIVRAAEPAIRKADPGASVAFGSLAPSGESGKSTNAKLKPLVFMRAFGCVTAKYKKTRTKACRGFKPAAGSLFAYHPHSLKQAPSTHDRDRDNAALADLGRLTKALDRIARAGGFAVRGGGKKIGLLLDEWSYQTNPPDKTLGVSVRQQSRWMQQGTATAALNARVRGLYWYVWKDEPLGPQKQGWQAGFHFLDGRAKPGLAAFARPFWAWKAARGVAGLWGQVRPGRAHDVTIERKSGSSWKKVASVRTDRYGVFSRRVKISAKTTFRFRWADGVSDSRVVAR